MTQYPRTPPPKRVRVTSPRQQARQPTRHTRQDDLDESTSLGGVYLDSLVRAQIRLAAALLIGIAVPLVGLPVLLLAVPEVSSITVAGLPVLWLVLGVFVYPFALIVTHWYVRAAEGVEGEFVELMERP